jgi:acetate kinase
MPLCDRATIEMRHEQSVHIDGVGHRLVFGGSAHEAPARVTDELMTSLDALVAVDPLHLPSALVAIREIETALPAVSQVLCFDTAFHHRMPMVAQRLPLPRELWSEGVRRYGFHGLSYESIVSELGDAGTRGRMRVDTVLGHRGSYRVGVSSQKQPPPKATVGASYLRLPARTPLAGTRYGRSD